MTDYYPYGSIRYNPTYDGFREQRKFTGQEYEDDTDMSYMGARYYNGNIGRFTTIDPLVRDFDQSRPEVQLMLMDPQLQNTYSYVRNNPLTYRDPNGEFLQVAAGALIGGAIGGLSTAMMGGNVHQTLAAIAGGAVAGAAFTLAGPVGLAETVGAGAVSNVAGASLTRALDGQGVNGGTVATDAIVGGVGGGLGYGVNKLIQGLNVTTNLENVSVRSFGREIYRGNVNLSDTVTGIKNGTIQPRMGEFNAPKLFQNREGLPGLDYSKGNQYYEYNVVNSGAPANNAERMLMGTVKGDMHYIPDHYKGSIFKIKK